jgi:hypothetical protein
VVAVAWPDREEAASPVISSVPRPTAPPPSVRRFDSSTTTTTRPAVTTSTNPPGYTQTVARLARMLTPPPAGFVRDFSEPHSFERASRNWFGAVPFADLGYRGGWGEVWLREDEQSGTRTEISVNLWEFADEQAATTFRDLSLSLRGPTAPPPGPYEPVPGALRVPPFSEVWVVRGGIVLKVMVTGSQPELVDAVVAAQAARL